MKHALFFLLFLGVSAFADGLSQAYSSLGSLVITQFESAPFPHPLRAEGHKYKDQLFPAKEHYQDNTVGIFIPRGSSGGAGADFVVHFHGWKNHVEGVLKRYQLIEQLSESKRNAILVVPQGPRDAPDSFGGKLEDPEGFKRFMNDVLGVMRQQPGFNKDCEIGQIILSGHSGGYQVISSILARGGLTGKVKEVWLFDALYAQTDKFLAWMDKENGRLLDIYTEHGGTKDKTEELITLLKKRGTPVFAGKELETKPSELETNHFVFLYSELEHNDVLDKHKTFETFLKTSGLAGLKNQN
jgi:hypothetical protein